jgi:hypothetical protein
LGTEAPQGQCCEVPRGSTFTNTRPALAALYASFSMNDDHPASWTGLANMPRARPLMQSRRWPSSRARCAAVGYSRNLHVFRCSTDGGRTAGLYLTALTGEVTAHQMLVKGPEILCNGPPTVAGIGNRLGLKAALSDLGARCESGLYPHG